MAAELDQILQEYVNPGTRTTGAVQGATFIVKDKNGKTLYSQSQGKLKYEPDSSPFDQDSVCWIASMTKLLTAVSVMQLVEKGEIGLDDDTENLAPQLAKMDVLTGFDESGRPIMEKRNKPITLRDLLSHSSGLTYDLMDPDLTKWSGTVGRTANASSYTLEGYTFPLKFQPGEGWAYGVGIDWAGHIVEVLSGKRLEEYMQENIFAPLGMSSTTFRISTRSDLAGKRATMGIRAEPRGPLTPGEDGVPEVQTKDGSGSGLYSTAADYSKFLAAILAGGKGILKPESVAELWTPQLPDNKYLMAMLDGPWHDVLCSDFPKGLPANYGLGGAINQDDLPGKRPKGSLMWSGMANTHWWIDSKTGIAATLMTQILPPGDAVVIDLFNTLEKAVYKALV